MPCQQTMLFLYEQNLKNGILSSVTATIFTPLYSKTQTLFSQTHCTSCFYCFPLINCSPNSSHITSDFFTPKSRAREFVTLLFLFFTLTKTKPLEKPLIHSVSSSHPYSSPQLKSHFVSQISRLCAWLSQGARTSLMQQSRLHI